MSLRMKKKKKRHNVAIFGQRRVATLEAVINLGG
jgi:hypothetical protein